MIQEGWHGVLVKSKSQSPEKFDVSTQESQARIASVGSKVFEESQFVCGLLRKEANVILAFTGVPRADGVNVTKGLLEGLVTAFPDFEFLEQAPWQSERSISARYGGGVVG